MELTAKLNQLKKKVNIDKSADSINKVIEGL